MVTLKGNELLQVVPIQTNGQPSAIVQQCTTDDIAALASSSTTSMVITALNTVGAGTITAAGIVGKITQRGGAQSGAAFTDTTDTATNIIAALPGAAPVGTSFIYRYQNTTNANATLAGGTGVTVSGLTVVPLYSWIELLVTYTAANTVTMVGISSGSNLETLPIVNTAITTVGAGTLTAASLVGQVITRSGSVAAYTDTTDTATAIIAAMPNAQIGEAFIAEIKNTVAFAETVIGGTGVTVSGISIIPPLSVGAFLVTYTAASTVTMVGIGAYPLTSPPVEAITALSTVGAGTITAAGIAGGVTNRTGSTAAFTDTTDTAANIIAARPNIGIGSSFEYTYYNNTIANATIAGGTGVTPSGITVIPANTWVRYLVTYTAAATITMVAIANGGNNVAPVNVGSSLSITTAMSGAPIMLDTAGGSTATLPAATGSGNTYRFYVKTTATSNAHKILAASVSDFLNGIVTGENANTAKCFASAAATNHSIQMPFAGTQPSGGFIGDWFEFTDIAANLWTVRGMYQAGVTPTTPFSSATS